MFLSSLLDAFVAPAIDSPPFNGGDFGAAGIGDESGSTSAGCVCRCGGPVGQRRQTGRGGRACTRTLGLVCKCTAFKGLRGLYRWPSPGGLLGPVKRTRAQGHAGGRGQARQDLLDSSCFSCQARAGAPQPLHADAARPAPPRAMSLPVYEPQQVGRPAARPARRGPASHDDGGEAFGAHVGIRACAVC